MKKPIKYPLRVGRKQRRVILDADGIEVAFFMTGSEEVAQEFCDLMNSKHKVTEQEQESPHSVFIVTGMCQGGEVEGYWKEIENDNSDNNE